MCGGGGVKEGWVGLAQVSAVQKGTCALEH